jgi:class 3 adenylate cyclase/tetratricopeptide (TPR) repeat protein
MHMSQHLLTSPIAKEKDMISEWSKLLPELVRYVSGEMFRSLLKLPEHFEHADKDTQVSIGRELEAVIRSLESLRRVLVNYMPRYLTDLNPATGVPHGELIGGTFLFADATGFTALAEIMARHDHARGQEVLNRIMNQVFANIMEPLISSGGDLLIFAGDAILAWFPRQDNDEDVLQAIRAGLRMQRAMASFASFETEFGPASLTMSIGVESGKAYAGVVGTEERMELLVHGPGTLGAIRAEEKAEPGQVIVGKKARAVAANSFTLKENQVTDDLGDDLGDYEISLPTRRTSGSTIFSLGIDEILTALDTALQRVRRLAPFLPEDMLARIVNSDRRELPPELRPVAVQFINLLGLEQLFLTRGLKTASAVFQRYFVRIQEIVSRHEGVVSQIDTYSKGVVFLNTFGSPKAHEGTKRYAVSSALQMTRALEHINREFNLDPPLQQRGGITYGLVFTGEAGARYRRESVILGTAVNRSARLMGSADPGQVIIDTEIWEDIRNAFMGETLSPVVLKGIDEPVFIVNVRRLKLGAQLRPPDRPLVGRESEQSRLSDALTALISSPEQTGEIWHISGETGLGKTALTLDFAEAAKKRGVIVLTGRCQPHGRHIPLFLWTDLLTEWISPDEATSDPAELRKQLGIRLNELEILDLENPLAYLMLLPVSFAENREFVPTEPLMILSVFESLADRGPLVIILEDIQWMDNESRVLLNALMQEIPHKPILLVMTCRDGRLANKADNVMPLGKLSSQALIEIAARSLGAESLDDSLAKWIADCSGGNPLYAEELCRSLKQEKAVFLNKGTGTASWTRKTPNLPLKLHELLLSRLDELPLIHQDVLKLGSVFGMRFEYDMLLRVSEKQIPAQEIRMALENFVSHSFLTDINGTAYQFCHPLMQEAIYETLSFKQRQNWHTAIGDLLASDPSFQEKHLSVAAYHYLRGKDERKAADFGRRAGDRAKQHREYTAAAEFYRQVLSLSKAPAAEKCQCSENLGDVQMIQGEYDAAGNDYEQAVKLGSEEAAGKLAILKRDIAHLSRGGFSEPLDNWAEGARSWIMAEEGNTASALEAAMAAKEKSEGKVRDALSDLICTLEAGNPPGNYEEWLRKFAGAVLQSGFSPIDLLDMPGETSGLVQTLIRKNGMTSEETAAELGIPPEEAQQHLDELIQKGLVRRVTVKGKTLYRAAFGKKAEKKRPVGLWRGLDDI